MNAVEWLRGLPGLVRLQVAYQVPPDLTFGRSLDLLQGFLHAVLAEVLLARGGRRPDVIEAECFGNGNEPYRRRVPTGGPRRGCQPRADRVEIACDIEVKIQPVPAIT